MESLRHSAWHTVDISALLVRLLETSDLSRTSTGYTSFRMLLKHDYAAGPTMTRRQGTVRGPLGLQAIGDKTLLIRHRHTACPVPVAAGADDQVYNEEVEKLRDRTAAYSTATCHTKECWPVSFSVVLALPDHCL